MEGEFDSILLVTQYGAEDARSVIELESSVDEGRGMLC